MVRTHGLTHVALAVSDVERSAEFYRQVLGMVPVYQDDTSVQLQTPGSRDVLVLDETAAHVGRAGGVNHFGFRLVDPGDMADALRALKAADTKVLSQGEFCPGQPYVFFADPDGYEIEVWYEQPTSVDPPAARRRKPGTRGARR